MANFQDENPRVTFNNLSKQFSQLLFHHTSQDKSAILKVLNELNALDFRYSLVNSNNPKAVLLIIQICNSIAPDDVALVSKCCYLITNFLNLQKVPVEGRSLEITTEWLVQCLEVTLVERVILEILGALESLLRNNPQQAFMILPHVVQPQNPVVKLAKSKNNPSMFLLATQCLELLCAPNDNYKTQEKSHLYNYFEYCAQIFIEYSSTEQSTNLDEVLFCKLLISCMKGLQNIILQHKECLKKNLETLMSISKTYMVYGIEGVSFVLLPKVKPSLMSIPEPIAKKIVDKRGGKVTKHRKKGTKISPRKDPSKLEDVVERSGYTPANTSFNNANNELSLPSSSCNLKTSDSDFSESEAGKERKIGVMQSRVRQTSLHLLDIIFKLTDKNIMFSYLSSFIPETQLTMSHSLPTCILKDPSSYGRLVALKVLYSLLSSSNFYLAQAESSEHVASFTPFSVTLASIIKQVHDVLSLALSDQSFPVLTQVLKCMTSLVQATPYHRLQPGLITKLVRNVKQFVRHRDIIIQVAVLILLGCVLVTEQIPETIESFLRNMPQEKKEKIKKINSEDFDFADFSSDEETPQEITATPWLLQYCLENLGVSSNEKPDNIPPPIKLESLQVLSAMSRHYFEKLMFPYLNSISNALELALSAKYPDVRFHAINSVDFIGQAMNRYLENNLHNIDKCLLFWQTLLNGSFITLLSSDEDPATRAVACNVIGSIGSHTFEQLSREKQLLCITSLFSGSRDEDPTVQGASVRALTICVFFPSLYEDIGFIMDVIEALERSLNDDSVGLRIKGYWSLGNLSDALVLHKSDPINTEIPTKSFLSLINCSLNGCKDNDKIKSNAVRSLGNLLQLIEIKDNDEHIILKIEEAMNSLKDCATLGTSMKVQWNACYAISNVLRNTTFYSSETRWLKTIFHNLQSLVVTHKNFKVRINAALALAAISSRDLYGDLLRPTWISLIKALENSDILDDFVEYKHRDTLVNQICLTLAHLIKLLKSEDLLLIGNNLAENMLRVQVRRVYNRVIPEKTSILIGAFDRLKQFNDLSSDQMEVVNTLKIIFENEVCL